MQQISPIGGLSLIIHLTINLIIFIYFGILKTLKISKVNFVSKYFKKLTNKEGDTFTRKALSYSLILVMFMVISTNFILITSKSFGFSPTKIALSQTLDFITKNKSTVNNQGSLTNAQIIALSSTGDENQTIIEIEKTISERLEEASNLTLVDFMEELGIVDTSFASRAEIAFEIGIIGSPEDYDGSVKQNKEIITRLKDEVNAHIVTQ